MFQYDFSNHQNRFIRIEDTPEGYLSHIERTTHEDPAYPCWHIAPPCGLLNDPCGLFQTGGVHHIFHQWFPAGPVHGLKYWRLLTTRDFVHFEDHGPQLSPGLPFDDHGCYTGMALTLAHGASERASAAGGNIVAASPLEAEVYYTGIAGEEMEASICMARCVDGEIVDRRRVIKRDPTLSAADFRDPCVFMCGGHENQPDPSGRKAMLVGSCSPEGIGQILLYAEKGAQDGECGSLPSGGNSSELFEARGALELRCAGFDVSTLGYMLECPNYYEDENAGAGVLFFSPMGIESPNKYDFKNVFSVVYAVGEPMDVGAGAFTCPMFYEMDKGFDFYAPQTYPTEDGRRILFGWLGNSKSPYPTDKNNWAHMLTTPREATVRGDRLVQRPIVELEALRGEGVALGSDAVAGRFGTSIALDPETATLDLDGFAEGEFSWELGNDTGECVRFTATADEYELDRGGMTELYAERFGTRRFARRLDVKTSVRLLLDTSSIELFLDNGKTVFTSRYFIDRPTYLCVRGIEGVWYPMSSIKLSTCGKQPWVPSGCH